MGSFLYMCQCWCWSLAPGQWDNSGCVCVPRVPPCMCAHVLWLGRWKRWQSHDSRLIFELCTYVERKKKQELKQRWKLKVKRQRVTALTSMRVKILEYRRRRRNNEVWSSLTSFVCEGHVVHALYLHWTFTNRQSSFYSFMLQSATKPRWIQHLLLDPSMMASWWVFMRVPWFNFTLQLKKKKVR